MREIRAELSKHPVSTPLLALNGPIVVARDIAHAKLKERLDRGEDLPQYFKDHPVYYAGPAKTPQGMPSGSFGPTTAGRMDSYVDLFQAHGGSLVMIAKGNRSKQVTEACRKHGGFYLGSIGGPAALLAKETIRKVELIEYPELGMEAVYRIEVVDFPAFILVDDKGNDFFQQVACRSEDTVIEPLRSAFNASWTESAYETYKERLAESAGSAIGFRICESPVFLPPALRDAMVQGALEIWEELLRPEALERSKAAVPPEFDVPASDDHPLFAQADFAIVEVEGGLAPRLIELQGFPSLYAFQLLQGRLCLDMVPGHGEPLEFLLSGLDDVGYRRVVGDAILGSHPAENVVLLDLDPPGQGTYPDFAATEKLFGIRAVCPTDVTKSGRELWYERDGKKTRILRVYNRLIVDEIVEKKVLLPFRFTEELDVEWAGHPNWFFRWSKHALPGLRHPLVPEARLLATSTTPRTTSPAGS